MACALAGPCASASAAGPTVTPAARTALTTSGRLSGTIAAIESDNFTIQTQGRQTGVINALVDGADAVANLNTPYVWGGGHGEAGVASVGDIGGPGANGRRIGFDCSGAIAAVLASAGLWTAGSAVPNDAGVIADLRAQGVIASGPGTAPNEVTLYDWPGVHIFMNIDGRFFGTSDGAGGGDAKGGAGWLDDSASDAHSRRFRQYHIIPSILRDRTTYGHEYTFQTDADPGALLSYLIGDKVNVAYRASGGSMRLHTVDWVGAQTANGTVSSLATDDSGLTIQTSSGQTLTLSTADVADAMAGVALGDTLRVVYLRSGSSLIARTLIVTATPPPQSATGTITAIAPDLSSFTIQTSAGQQLTFETGGDAALLTGLTVGNVVEVDYKQLPGALTATTITPVQTSGPPPVAPTAPDPGGSPPPS